MVSVLCLTALFSRPEVAELCFIGLNRLRGEFNIQPLAVYTGDFAPLCKRYDVIGLEYKNQPLGEKFNAGLREALKRKWDYLMTIGSDDLIANELLRLYPWDSEAFGITRCGMLDLRTGRKKVFNNSYPIGLGRCVRRDVIEELGDQVTIKYRYSGSGPDRHFTARKEVKMARKFANRLTRCSDIIAEHNEEIRLWPDNIDRGLDFSSEVYLNRNGITVKKILTDSILAVDLKSDVNIWSFDTNYDAGEFELDWISTKEKNAIRRFKTPDND